VKAVLDEAVANATGLSGDRLAMLRDALEAVGRRTEDVRLVRVFGADEEVPGATAIGGRQYVVDYFPASMKQVAGSSKDDRGRRGGGGRGGGGGGRGGGGRGAKAGTTGGFSMDALRDDRKGGGRGRPGGGARPRGGGSPGGGRGGDPKK
jgi:translation initiation factor IF-2